MFYSQNTKICHQLSKQNYLKSPKKTLKDYSFSMKNSKNGWKPINFDHKNEKNIYDKQNKQRVVFELLNRQKKQQLTNKVHVLQSMQLMKQKPLHMTSYGHSLHKTIDSCTHHRQSNAGYSRNKFGGFYTK